MYREYFGYIQYVFQGFPQHPDFKNFLHPFMLGSSNNFTLYKALLLKAFVTNLIWANQWKLYPTCLSRHRGPGKIQWLPLITGSFATLTVIGEP